MSTRKAGTVLGARQLHRAMDLHRLQPARRQGRPKGAMELEADRMVQLHLTDEDVEAVRRRIIEMRKVLAQYAEHKFLEQMLASVYLFHPYRVPVTGWGHEIETLSLEDAVRFQKLHYAPNNAVLVVAGDVTPDEIKSLSPRRSTARSPANPQIEDRRRTRSPLQPPHAASRSKTQESARRCSCGITSCRATRQPSRRGGSARGAIQISLTSPPQANRRWGEEGRRRG